MDLIGKGMNIRNGVNVDKGIVWVARRVPDGYICAHANQARIGKFPLNDPENCLYAKDVISFARKKGYFQGEDEDFDFSKAYAPWDFETTRACDARVWSAYNLLCNGWFTYTEESGRILTKDAYTYVDYALGYDLENRIPLFVKPNHKVGVKELADAMRDHFEGTPMDMTQDIGAGGNGLPYRWRPMRFASDGKRYLNERAIATQQTGFGTGPSLSARCHWRRDLVWHRRCCNFLSDTYLHQREQRPQLLPRGQRRPAALLAYGIVLDQQPRGERLLQDVRPDGPLRARAGGRF